MNNNQTRYVAARSREVGPPTPHPIPAAADLHEVAVWHSDTGGMGGRWVTIGWTINSAYADAQARHLVTELSHDAAQVWKDGNLAVDYRRDDYDGLDMLTEEERHLIIKLRTRRARSRRLHGKR